MKYDGILSCPSLCLTNQLIYRFFFIKYASRCVLYYKERNKQMTIEYISFLENINMFRPRDVIIRLALEHFKGIYKSHFWK